MVAVEDAPGPRDCRPLYPIIELPPPEVKSRRRDGEGAAAMGFSHITDGAASRQRISHSADSPMFADDAASDKAHKALMERQMRAQRLDSTIQACKIAHANRIYRYNGLGVFDATKNEVRARSLTRVQMHKELSPASLRLPNTHKEVKLEGRQEESLAQRLEKMCNRVIRSLEDRPRAHGGVLTKRLQSEHMKKRDMGNPGTSRTMPAAGPITPRGGVATATSGEPASRGGRRGAPAMLSRVASVAGSAPGGVGEGSASTGFVGASAPSFCGRTGSIKGTRPQLQMHATTSVNSKHLDWIQHAPPEVAAAHMLRLEAKTERHIALYHQHVAEAQRDVLLTSGLPAHAVSMTPADLEVHLAAQRTNDGAVPNDDDQLEEREVKPVSVQLHCAATIPDLIRAALQHVDMMSEELQGCLSSRTSMPDTSQLSTHRSVRRPLKLPHDSIDSGTTSAEATPGAGDAAASQESSPSAAVLTISRSMKERERAGSVSKPARPPVFLPERRAAFAQALAAGAKEVAAGSYRLLDLPAVPPAPSASLHVQARLERLWSMLHTPLPGRVDSVIAFTAREHVGDFEKALEAWERCAVAVQHRESLLEELSSIQHGITSRTVPYVQVSQVTPKCVELHKVTLLLVELTKGLTKFGVPLMYAGEPYPGPDVVSDQDMLRFIDWMQEHEGDVHFVA